MMLLHSAAAIVRAALAPIIVFGLSLSMIFALQPVGHDGLVAIALAILLALLVIGVRFEFGGSNLTQRVQIPAAAALACWLGLLGWSKLAKGGPAPAAKQDSAAIRVLTWNIHCGQEDGPPWKRFDWSERKHALETALHDAGPDILCVQEGLAEQLGFLDGALPGHRRAGVGRDGGAAGEFCAIYFNQERFELRDGDTFWLEEPTDVPGDGSLLHVKRICTWVRLRDRNSGRTLRVYNLHSYLTEGARQRATRLILERIAAGDPGDDVIVCGDFNAPPAAASRRDFAAAGLTDSAELAGKGHGAPTFHYWGIPVRRLDAILLSPGWRVSNHRALDVKPGNTFPSDHFGVLADLRRS
jgi:endonuclease/exonuclease/phosphatase family metal-dependent hydrolase